MRQIILVMHNIRSCYNVGAILRTAEGFGVLKVILSGYTPRVHDANLLPHLRAKLDNEIHKTALGAEDMLDIYACDDIKTEVRKLKMEGWQIVGLENNIECKTYLLGSEELHEKLSDKVYLIEGAEVNKLDNSIHELTDQLKENLKERHKESFNVSVATGIALFGIL